MNNIQLTGRVTKNIRSNNVDGTAVVNFTVAVELGTKSQIVTMNGKEILAQVPATSYIDAAAWGPNAAAASSLEAGQEVSFTVDSLGSKGREYNGKILSDVIARVSAVTPGAKAKAKAPVAAAAEEAIF
jgi:hypothetical protein